MNQSPIAYEYSLDATYPVFADLDLKLKNPSGNVVVAQSSGATLRTAGEPRLLGRRFRHPDLHAGGDRGRRLRGLHPELHLPGRESLDICLRRTWIADEGGQQR